MGQKVHPVGFRLGITRSHPIQWFSKVGKTNNYGKLVEEDTLIRKVLFKKLPSLHNVSIQRKNTTLFIHLESSEPEENEKSIEEIKKELQILLHKKKEESKKFLNLLNPNLSEKNYFHPDSSWNTKESYTIFCTLSRAKDISAQSIANFIKERLEMRLPFRQAMKKSLKLAKLRGVKGMKIEISGRLNGAEIARTEWERYGAVSLQTLRSNIDYTECTAQTIYGILGIKVWVQA